MVIEVVAMGLASCQSEERALQPGRSANPRRRGAMIRAVPLTIYTDGSCLRNPGPGGWAWAVPDGPFASGAEAETTNQRMEVLATLEALRANDADEVEIVSDSKYVVLCFQDRWWAGWQRRGWKNSQGKPVANRDLWEPLLELALAPARTVHFSWVKGHSGDRWNDRVDQLALEAAQRQVGRTGTA
jgi:ribonuclease HI